MKLTNAEVAKISNPDSGYLLHWDSELKGFGIRITQAGSKSYIAQAKVNGKSRRVTLGKHGVITADQARKKAKKALGKMADGTDLIAEKRLERATSVSLDTVVGAYLKNRRTRAGLPLKERTKKDISYHLKTNFSAWRSKPVADISREMIQRRYADIARRSVAQANQAFRVLSAILNFAAASYRTPDGERIITDNPVSVLREANLLRAVKPKSGSVPLDQLGKWWSAVQAMRADPSLTTAGRSAADMIALLAVTGLRLGEARSVRWEQINLLDQSLSLTDTKNRTDVTLPLSCLAAEIIDSRPRRGDYVFPPRTNSGKLPHMKDCRAQLEILAGQTEINVTAHDLRRTFRAVAAVCEVELWRCKALMNHKQNQDVTLSHYTDLSDVRNLKPEADRISDYFEQQRRVFESDNVFSLERRA